VPTAHDHETGFAAFVARPKRERVVATLGDPRRRRKTLNKVLYAGHWDPRFVVVLPPAVRADDVLRELRARGAPAEAYVISASPALEDGRFLALVDALRTLVDAGNEGVFVSCIPGRLGYWHSEHAGKGTRDHLLLQRTA
jgi:hypothetical protein